jgi:hypothetical protein
MKGEIYPSPSNSLLQGSKSRGQSAGEQVHLRRSRPFVSYRIFVYLENLRSPVREINAEIIYPSKFA